MANTTTKVNSFLALGYSFTARDTQIDEYTPVFVDDDEQPKENTTEIETENILPNNNQVLRTINLNTNIGLKI